MKSRELIGCSPSELKQYIEKQFKLGMTWENYKLHGWEVDHIVPCDSFDLTNVEEQKKCFHYTNLQPLWMRENRQKSCKIQ
jgi:DNA/RNA endonuclease G (NUC1)